MATAYKRKQYIVSARFQLKYVGVILLLIFLTAILCSYVVYYTTMIGLGEKLANVYPQGRLLSIVKAVNIRIFVSLIVVTPFVVMYGIYLSHKIAGPIFRIERFLHSMASGDLTERLTLRKNDELINVADAINSVVDNYRGATITEKNHVERISKEVEKLRIAIESATTNPAIINELMDNTVNHIADLRIELDKYKVEKPK